MPRHKKSTVDRFMLAQPLSALFAHQVIYDKLRTDLFATTEKLGNQLVALRNSIPVVPDRDAHNVLHQTILDIEDRIDSIRNNLDIILSRQIKSYKQLRAEKRKKRRAAATYPLLKLSPSNSN